MHPSTRHCLWRCELPEYAYPSIDIVELVATMAPARPLTVIQRCNKAVVVVSARRDHFAVEVALGAVHGDGEGDGLVHLDVLGYATQFDFPGVARLWHHVHLERAVRDVLVVELDAHSVLACTHITHVGLRVVWAQVMATQLLKHHVHQFGISINTVNISAYLYV